MEKYRYEKHIEQGMFGETFLASNEKSELCVIKKVKLFRNDVNYIKMSTMMNNEVSIHRKLNGHPNIIHFYDSFIQGDVFYIVQEYANKGDLENCISSTQIFSMEKICDFILQIINAVEHCHSHSIIHRDIKTENVVLSTSESKDIVKLIDFGYAIEYKYTEPRRLTEIAGTISCLSPEMLSHSGYDYDIDIWQIGVLAFELSTRHSPFIKIEEDLKNESQVINTIISLNYQHPFPKNEKLSNLCKRTLVPSEQRISLEEIKKILYTSTSPDTSRTLTNKSASPDASRTLTNKNLI